MNAIEILKIAHEHPSIIFVILVLFAVVLAQLAPRMTRLHIDIHFGDRDEPRTKGKR